MPWLKTTLNDKPAKIMLNQCIAVDKSRLKEKIGVVDSSMMNEEAIRIVFGLS